MPCEPCTPEGEISSVAFSSCFRTQDDPEVSQKVGRPGSFIHTAIGGFLQWLAPNDEW